MIANRVFRLSLMALALAGASNGFAATVVTTSMNQSTATDNTNNGNYGSAVTAGASFTLPQYSGGGVLTGVTFSAASSASTSITDNSIWPYSTGTARLSGTYSVAGASASGNGTGNVVSPVGPGSNSYTLSYSTNTATVSAANLGAFVTGNVSGTVSESVDISKTSGTPQPSSMTISANPGSHSATVTYTYTDQAHANGSIGTGPSNPGVGVNTLSNTFEGSLGGGLFQLGEASQPYAFDIFNGAGLFGMDITNIACSGHCGVFSLTGTFQNIAGGGSASGSVSFDGATPLVPTAYHATYTFQVGDDAGLVGAGKNFNIENLTLTVMAQAVPEPQEWAMMLLGLGLVGMAARRRRAKQRAG